MVASVAMRTPLRTLYKVTVSYREPSYEERAGPRANPYQWTYTVLAGSEEQARRRALEEFEEVTRLSSVGWSRQVVAVDVWLTEPPDCADRLAGSPS